MNAPGKMDCSLLAVAHTHDQYLAMKQNNLQTSQQPRGTPSSVFSTVRHREDYLPFTDYEGFSVKWTPFAADHAPRRVPSNAQKYHRGHETARGNAWWDTSRRCHLLLSSYMLLA